MSRLTGQSYDPSGWTQTTGGAGTGVAPQMQGGWSPQQLAAQKAAQYQFSSPGAEVSGGPSQAAQDAQRLASIPVNAQMQRFSTILPYLTGALGSFGSDMARAGGQNTPAPEITTGGVLNPQQIQQQVNTSRAANDQATQGQIRDTNASMAGRGFGSNSPLAAALGQSAQNQNLQTNTANETQTRLGAAQANAGQLLQSQQARSNQWQQQNALDVERLKPVYQRQNALIAALGSLA